MKANDASLDGFLRNAYGYAIFPSVGKGGFIVGGGHGRGEVYEQGKFIGFADITQATVGAQVGGQTYSELIVFQNKQALDNFRYGKIKFTANASAVAIKSGASAAANYSNGVAIFTMAQGGLMAEAAVGGQEFGLVPATDADLNMRNDLRNANGPNDADLARPASSTDRVRIERYDPTTRPATNPTLP
jgi:lipid-binding SYLF domain-containing protein